MYILHIFTVSVCSQKADFSAAGVTMETLHDAILLTSHPVN